MSDIFRRSHSRYKVFFFCFFYLPDSSSKPFLPSIYICDMMCFLDSRIYLVFKNIYFYGSIICIFQVMRENVHGDKKKSPSEMARDIGKYVENNQGSKSILTYFNNGSPSQRP